MSNNINNPQLVQSPLLSELGISHGWFMRYGGVSRGLFESLNGKKGNGDKDIRVDENRRRALTAIGGTNESNLVHIMHSFNTNVLEAAQPGEFAGYDASFTLKDNVILSQTTADCGSVIITSIDGSIVALVHGSWHTVRDKIICKTVAKLKEYTNNELVAGIGPIICKDCYEFGTEAAGIFAEKYLQKHGKKYLVNLKCAILDQLQESGVLRVDDVAICTKEDERFFSHRRSGAKSGRFLTLVMPGGTSRSNR